MCGDDEICGSLFSYIDLEKRVRSDHPLRVIRQIANAALAALTGTFEPLYSPLGRSSILNRIVAEWAAARRSGIE